MERSKWLDAIAKERRRQVDRFGYDAEHDANEYHQDGQLAQAACYMAWPADKIGGWRDPESRGVACLFPESWYINDHSYRDGKTPQQRLIVAGALILAELERLEALESSVAPGR